MWTGLVTWVLVVANILTSVFETHPFLNVYYLCCLFDILSCPCSNTKSFLTKLNDCFYKIQIVNSRRCIIRTHNTMINQHFLHTENNRPVQNIYVLLQRTGIWYWTYSWSQRSRFSWIFFTILVKSFLPGLNDATISSTCWILQKTLKHQIFYCYFWPIQNLCSRSNIIIYNINMPP